MVPDLKTLPQPIAVVCHDAGAANIVLAEMLAAPDVNFLPVMQGPAARLFTDSGFAASTLLTLDGALLHAKSVLSGTGWASELEHDARCRAKAMHLKSIAVIDHWVNYADRFERRGLYQLPDEIWVSDTYALEISLNAFAGQVIGLLPNRYLQTQIKNIAPASSSLMGQLLYVLEPLRFSWPGCQQAGEFEALDYFVNNLGRIKSAQKLQIRLRPHPSDAPGKYNTWLEANQGRGISMDDSASLSQAIGRAQWVAGCETAAMVVALAAGRNVVSTLPPDAPRCRLPHTGIVHLRNL